MKPPVTRQWFCWSFFTFRHLGDAVARRRRHFASMFDPLLDHFVLLALFTAVRAALERFVIVSALGEKAVDRNRIALARFERPACGGARRCGRLLSSNQGGPGRSVRAGLHNQCLTDLQRVFHAVVAVAADDDVDAVYFLCQLFVGAQAQMRQRDDYRCVSTGRDLKTSGYPGRHAPLLSIQACCAVSSRYTIMATQSVATITVTRMISPRSALTTPLSMAQFTT